MKKRDFKKLILLGCTAGFLAVSPSAIAHEATSVGSIIATSEDDEDTSSSILVCDSGNEEKETSGTVLADSGEEDETSSSVLLAASCGRGGKCGQRRSDISMEDPAPQYPQNPNGQYQPQGGAPQDQTIHQGCAGKGNCSGQANPYNNPKTNNPNYQQYPNRLT